MAFTTIRQSGSQEKAQQTSVSNPCAGQTRTAAIDVLKKAFVAVGISQAMVAALMLFAGGVQLVLPIAEMAKPTHPGVLLDLIDAAQVVHGISLTVPGLMQIVLGRVPLMVAVIVWIATVRWTMHSQSTGTSPCAGGSQ